MKPEIAIFSKENPVNKKEEWRDIAGTCGQYRISSLGRVMSLPTKYKPRIVILKPWYQTSMRYPVVRIFSKTRTVHSLVAEAFIGARPDGQNVRHLDGNGRNSCLSNLAYGTQAENLLDRRMHGTAIVPKKLSWRKVLRARRLMRDGLTDSQVAAIFSVSTAMMNLIRNKKAWVSYAS